MRYLCVNRNDSDCYSMGETVDDALINYINNIGDVEFNDLDWYEMKAVSVKMLVETIEAKPSKKGKV